MDPQLKRGMLEACVLTTLRGGESYGYRIIQELGPVLELSDSTLYPVLKRLEQGGLVTASTREYNGRLRRYYSITEAGHGRIREFLDDWTTAQAVIDYIRAGEQA